MLQPLQNAAGRPTLCFTLCKNSPCYISKTGTGLLINTNDSASDFTTRKKKKKSSFLLFTSEVKQKQSTLLSSGLHLNKQLCCEDVTNNYKFEVIIYVWVAPEEETFRTDDTDESISMKFWGNNLSSSTLRHEVRWTASAFLCVCTVTNYPPCLTLTHWKHATHCSGLTGQI